MANESARDQATDHLLTPRNSALVVIDYQPSQVQTVTSMDRELLIDTIVSVDRHIYGYEQVLTLAPRPVDRVDTTWVYGANLGYRMRRDVRIGFGARYYQRDSTTVSFVQFDGLRFGATVNYGF